jgi:hypothetical protein
MIFKIPSQLLEREFLFLVGFLRNINPTKKHL